MVNPTLAPNSDALHMQLAVLRLEAENAALVARAADARSAVAEARRAAEAAVAARAIAEATAVAQKAKAKAAEDQARAEQQLAEAQRQHTEAQRRSEMLLQAKQEEARGAAVQEAEAKFRWEWQRPEGQWKPYTPLISFEIEQRHAAGKDSCRFSLESDGGAAAKDYQINFASMEQTNLVSGKRDVTTWFFKPHNQDGKLCRYDPPTQKKLERHYQAVGRGGGVSRIDICNAGKVFVKCAL